MKILHPILNLFLLLTTAVAGHENSQGEAEQLVVSNGIAQPESQHLASHLLEKVLKKQLKEDKPKYGETYVFVASKEGCGVLDDYVNANDGAHIVLLIAQWSDPADVDGNTPALQASTFDLATPEKYKNSCGLSGNRAVYSKQAPAETKSRVWDDARAHYWHENLHYQCRALGSYGMPYPEYHKIIEDVIVPFETDFWEIFGWNF